MEEIDKVYAEDLLPGDVVRDELGHEVEVVKDPRHDGTSVIVDIEDGYYMEYAFGSLVPIYGYMSIEV